MIFLCLLALGLAASAHANALVGYCPVVFPSAIGTCLNTTDTCNSDGDCNFPQLCCNNGCRSECIPGVFSKPGVCPTLTNPPVCVTFRNQCNGRDFGCPGFEKCCLNPNCGDYCKLPVPCSNINCPPGFVCQVQNGTGTCINPCAAVSCMLPQVCHVVNNTGVCVDPCAGVQCPPGTVCQGGNCVGSCAAVSCILPQVCQVVNNTGVCVDPCAGVQCPPGTVCQGGNCVGSCAAVSCILPHVCKVVNNTGVCVDPCAGFTCGVGQACHIVSGTAQCANVAKCPVGDFLPGVNCGRGGVRCPDNYNCKIHPTDRYAVCCPETCETKKCEDYEVCKLVPIVCKTTPCNPIAKCQPKTCDDINCLNGQICEMKPSGDTGCRSYPTCIIKDPCKHKKCPFYKRCVNLHGRPRCKCKPGKKDICKKYRNRRRG